MKTAELKKKAEALYKLNQTIKAATEKADELKKTLRVEMVEDIELTSGVICKRVPQISPVLNLKKLYGRLTMKEMCTATKPIMTKLKEIFTDQYDVIIDACTDGVEETVCIKFSEPKKEKRAKK